MEAIGLSTNDTQPIEQLSKRKEKVIDIMITLFGQEYAVEAYAEDKARTREY